MHLQYMDLQNLVNVDPDPGRIQDNKNKKFISNHLLKVNKKKYFQICN